jgi:hypothetical protein
MSWLQWQGETWPATEDEAELRVCIAAPDSAGPRVTWWWECMHIVREPGSKDGENDRWLSVRIDDLGIREGSWERLAGREIRADAAWHDAQENTGCYGRLQLSQVEVSTDPPKGASREDAHWIGHDFIMRIGQRDGLYFPVELDAWVIPAREYEREVPETAMEVAQFGVGPPHLRLIARMAFLNVSVNLARCSGDPMTVARRVVREEIGFRDLQKAEMKGWLRDTVDRAKIVEMPPGWRSSVNFRTAAAKW